LRGRIGSGQTHVCPKARWRSWGLTLRSVVPAHGWRMRLRAAGPTCHFPERPPRYFSSRDRPSFADIISTPLPRRHAVWRSLLGRTCRPAPTGRGASSKYGRSGTLRSASGIWPREQSVPAEFSLGDRRVAPADGPILPWAFGLSQAFGSGHRADTVGP
jgi:hypothetical protein